MSIVAFALKGNILADFSRFSALSAILELNSRINPVFYECCSCSQVVFDFMLFMIQKHLNALEAECKPKFVESLSLYFIAS